MQVAKTFDRNGVRYRPGDDLPKGLDVITLAHYKRHGMVAEAKPAETKPAAPARRTGREPKQTKPAAPANIGAAVNITESAQEQSSLGDLGEQQQLSDEAPGPDAEDAQQAAAGPSLDEPGAASGTDKLEA